MSLIPFIILIAILPLPLYFLRLAILNYTGHPNVVAGWKDNAYLAFAISGLMMVGPGQLIIPVHSMIDKGIGAWVLLFLLYLFVTIFLSGQLRPRIVIYNITKEELHSLLAELSLEPERKLEHKWLGNSLDLPGLGVHLYLETSSFFRNITLMAAGRQGNNHGWKLLEQKLATSCHERVTSRNILGPVFGMMSILFIVVMIWLILCYETSIVEGLLLSL